MTTSLIMYDRPSVERAAGVSLQKATDSYIWLICLSFTRQPLLKEDVIFSIRRFVYLWHEERWCIRNLRRAAVSRKCIKAFIHVAA